MSKENETIDSNELHSDVAESVQEPVKQEAPDLFAGVQSASFTTVDLEKEADKLKNEEKQDYSGSEDQAAAPDQGAPVNDPGPKKNNQKSAERIVKASDKGIAFLLAWVAKDESSEIYRAKESELKEIASELAEGFEEMGMEVKMPWWFGLAVVAFIAYGDKVKLAIQRRKINEARKAKAKQTQGTEVRVPRPPESGDIEEAVVIVETVSTRPCEYCGNETTNARYCSKRCSAKANAEKGTVGRKKKNAV